MDNLTVLKTGMRAFFQRDWTLMEKILLVVDCILAGVLLGALWSPRREKHTTIGSFNSGNSCGNKEEEDENLSK